ncbi:MAG: type II toxin-antitoxin system RelE/ParE family toxin [Schumannella sp.]|nr:type II toxin-antitoxin system RelE/ParE family toxin [Microbacteriaceae bacterium]
MRQLRSTPAARRDLLEIWDYTAGLWGVARAESYIGEIGAALERIAVDPARGRTCDEIRPGYRRYGIGSHVVFYLETEDTVDIVRVLHQRLDPGRHLF